MSNVWTTTSPIDTGSYAQTKAGSLTIQSDFFISNTTSLNTTQIGDDVAAPIDVLNIYSNTTIGSVANPRTLAIFGTFSMTGAKATGVAPTDLLQLTTTGTFDTGTTYNALDIDMNNTVNGATLRERGIYIDATGVNITNAFTYHGIEINTPNTVVTFANNGKIGGAMVVDQGTYTATNDANNRYIIGYEHGFNGTYNKNTGGGKTYLAGYQATILSNTPANECYGYGAGFVVNWTIPTIYRGVWINSSTSPSSMTLNNASIEYYGAVFDARATVTSAAIVDGIDILMPNTYTGTTTREAAMHITGAANTIDILTGLTTATAIGISATLGANAQYSNINATTTPHTGTRGLCNMDIMSGVGFAAMTAGPGVAHNTYYRSPNLAAAALMMIDALSIYAAAADDATSIIYGQYQFMSAAIPNGGNPNTTPADVIAFGQNLVHDGTGGVAGFYSWVQGSAANQFVRGIYVDTITTTAAKPTWGITSILAKQFAGSTTYAFYATDGDPDGTMPTSTIAIDAGYYSTARGAGITYHLSSLLNAGTLKTEEAIHIVDNGRTGGFMISGASGTSTLTDSYTMMQLQNSCHHDGVGADTLQVYVANWGGNLPSGTLASSWIGYNSILTSTVGIGGATGGSIYYYNMYSTATFNGTNVNVYGLNVDFTSSTVTSASQLYGIQIAMPATYANCVNTETALTATGNSISLGLIQKLGVGEVRAINITDTGRTTGYLISAACNTSTLTNDFNMLYFIQQCNHDGVHADDLFMFDINWTGNVPQSTLDSNLTLANIYHAGNFGSGGADGGNARLLTLESQATYNGSAIVVQGAIVSLGLSTVTSVSSMQGIYLYMPLIYQNATARIASIETDGDGSNVQILSGSITKTIDAFAATISTTDADNHNDGIYIVNNATAVAGARVQDGYLLNYTSTLTSNGSNLTRQTNPLINMALTLTETANTLTMASGIANITVATGGTTPELSAATMWNMETIGTGLITGPHTFVSYSQAFAHDGAAADRLYGISMVWSGNQPQTSANSLLDVIYIAHSGTIGSGGAEGGYAYLFSATSTATLNGSSVVYRGVDVNLSTVTDTSFLGLFGICISMPTVYAGVGSTRAGSFDGDGSNVSLLYGTTTKTIDAFAATLSTTDADNHNDGIYIVNNATATGAARVQDGYLLNYTSTLQSNGFNMTRQTNPLINMAVTLTETANVCTMSSGFINMSTLVGAGTPTLYGNMVSLALAGTNDQGQVLRGYYLDSNVTLDNASAFHYGSEIYLRATVTLADTVVGSLIDLSSINTPNNAAYVAGQKIAMPLGRAPALDASGRGVYSGRIEQGAPTFVDEYWGRVQSAQWAAALVSGAGSITAAPASDINGWVRYTTDAAQNSVVVYDWAQIYCFQNTVRPTFEVKFNLAQVDTETDLFVGFMDADTRAIAVGGNPENAFITGAGAANREFLGFHISNTVNASTNFFLHACNANVHTTDDAGVAPVNGREYILRMEFKSDTEVEWFIFDVTAGTLTSYGTIATNIPTTVLSPVKYVLTRANPGAKTCDFGHIKIWTDKN